MHLMGSLSTFQELSYNELMVVDGGGWPTVVGAVAAGAIGIIAGPPAVITGGIAVGAWYVGSALIAAGGVVSAFE